MEDELSKSSRFFLGIYAGGASAQIENDGRFSVTHDEDHIPFKRWGGGHTESHGTFSSGTGGNQGRQACNCKSFWY